MCHGRLDIIPCSKVGHIYRDSVPYHVQEDAHEMNMRRTAHLWMDDYERLFVNSRDFLEEIDHPENEPQRRKIQGETTAEILAGT